MRLHVWVQVHAKATNTPFVLLSNTGAKNSTAVQEKLASALYEIDDEPVPLEHIHTAAEAQVRSARSPPWLAPQRQARASPPAREGSLHRA